MTNVKIRYSWLLAGICLAALFLFLGETSFHTKGEPREAVVAYAMLERGNWILPVNNGVDIAYKPPLFHWAIAAVSALCGGVSEYTARFPSALALACLVMGTYAFYARRRGQGLAFVAALVTLTNFEVHRAGLNCRVDMLLAALMVGALFQLYYWYERQLRGIPWLAILFLSGAALTKGPVGIVLPCFVAFVFAWIRGGRFLALCGKFAAVALAACVLPLAWYYAAWQQEGDRFLALVLEENVLRFAGKMSYASHENPAYYNVITLVAGFAPYTLFGVLSLFYLSYRKPRVGSLRSAWERCKAWVREMDDVRLYTLLSIVLMFVFYCIPKSKRSVYLLPLYPFIAYYVAEYFFYLRAKHPAALKLCGRVLAGAVLLLTATFCFVRLGGVQEEWVTGRHAAETWSYIEALRTAPLGIGSLLLVALPPYVAINFLYILKTRETHSFAPIITLVLFLYLALDGFYQPTILNVKSDKPTAAAIARLVPEGRLYSYRSQNVAGNRMHPFSLNFYLGDRIAPFQDFMPTEGYLVMGKDERPAFLEAYGDDYTLEEIYDARHRSCDDRSWTRLYKFKSKK